MALGDPVTWSRGCERSTVVSHPSIRGSPATVKAHLTSVFARIGVSDRTQAALWAERHDL